MTSLTNCKLMNEHSHDSHTTALISHTAQNHVNILTSSPCVAMKIGPSLGAICFLGLNIFRPGPQILESVVGGIHMLSTRHHQGISLN